MAGTGPATSTHIAFEVFKRSARLDMTFVPFPGNGPTVNALLGNHVTSAELNFADVGEHLKVGRNADDFLGPFESIRADQFTGHGSREGLGRGVNERRKRRLGVA